MEQSREELSEAEMTKATLAQLGRNYLSNFEIEDDPADWNKLFFKIEKAHWKYIDDYRPANWRLPQYRKLGEFAQAIFSRCEPLKVYRYRARSLAEQFVAYKGKLPTSGAILLNASKTKVLIVRACTKKARWGFPKGKVEDGDSELRTAIREVEEEIGFNISENVDQHNRITHKYEGKQITRFFVTNVPETYDFKTAANEIEEIRWVRIEDLPDSPKEAKAARTCRLQLPGEDMKKEERYVEIGVFGIALYTKLIRDYVNNKPLSMSNLTQGSPTSKSERSLPRNENAPRGRGSGSNNWRENDRRRRENRWEGHSR